MKYFSILRVIFFSKFHQNLKFKYLLKKYACESGDIFFNIQKEQLVGNFSIFKIYDNIFNSKNFKY